MQENLKTVKEIAPILKCSPCTIYRLVESGKLPHHRIGMKYLFTQKDIEDYLNSCRFTPTVNDKGEAGSIPIGA
jgi:excisionase family DNA binding protein